MIWLRHITRECATVVAGLLRLTTARNIVKAQLFQSLIFMRKASNVLPANCRQWHNFDQSGIMTAIDDQQAASLLY